MHPGPNQVDSGATPVMETSGTLPSLTIDEILAPAAVEPAPKDASSEKELISYDDLNQFG